MIEASGDFGYSSFVLAVQGGDFGVDEFLLSLNLGVVLVPDGFRRVIELGDELACCSVY